MKSLLKKIVEYGRDPDDDDASEIDFRSARTFIDKQESQLQAKERQAMKKQSTLSAGGGGGIYGSHNNKKSSSTLNTESMKMYGGNSNSYLFGNDDVNGKRRKNNKQKGNNTQESSNCVARCLYRCLGPCLRVLQRRVLPIPIDHDLYMTLSIWGRFRKYRHIPFTFIVNILLCFLLFGYIQAYQLFVNDYVVQSRYALSSMLVASEDEADGALKKNLKSIAEFTTFLEDWVSGYYSIPMTSLGVFQHFTTAMDDNDPKKPELVMRYATDRTFSTFYTLTFELQEDDPLGPLANVSILVSQNETCLPHNDFDNNHVIPCRNDTTADFFDMFASAGIKAQIRGVVANPAYKYASALKWDLSTEFAFDSHNSQLTAKTRVHFTETQRLHTAPAYVVIIIGILAMYGVVSKLGWWSRHARYPQYAKSEGHVKKYLTAKRWNIYGVFADAVTLAFSFYTITTSLLAFQYYDTIEWKCVILGSAAFVQILFILSHFQNVARMYVIAQSIGNALPNLGAYFVSVFPMFFGFCVCGSAAFGGLSNLFDTLPNSMVTFFSMIGGDSLLDIYTWSNQTTFLPLQIFTAIIIGGFIIFFIGCMLNMMLAIVQDSYQVGRALNDMDERVMRELRREEKQKEMLNRHYTEARHSGLDDGGFASIATRKTFRAAMVGLETGDLNNNNPANGGGGDKQPTRFEPFSTSELIALRKRFLVMPRPNIGLDCSSSSGSDSSGSGDSSDDDFKIDENLRKRQATEQKKKIRQMRGGDYDDDDEDDDDGNNNNGGGGGGGGTAGPRASNLNSLSNTNNNRGNARRGGNNTSSPAMRPSPFHSFVSGEPLDGHNNNNNNTNDGGFNGVGGDDFYANPARHNRKASPRLSNLHSPQLQQHQQQPPATATDADGFDFVENAALIGDGEHDMNGIDTEYLLTDEGYDYNQRRALRAAAGAGGGAGNAAAVGGGVAIGGNNYVRHQSPAMLPSSPPKFRRNNNNSNLGGSNRSFNNNNNNDNNSNKTRASNNTNTNNNSALNTRGTFMSDTTNSTMGPETDQRF